MEKIVFENGKKYTKYTSKKSGYIFEEQGIYITPTDKGYIACFYGKAKEINDSMNKLFFQYLDNSGKIQETNTVKQSIKLINDFINFYNNKSNFFNK